MGIPKTTSLVKKSMKFVARLSTMGNDKVVIYVPREYHKTLLGDFKGKPLKVTIEEILED
jgi:hypothetical protein